MDIQDFDYELPVDRIALFPPKVRGTSKLLVLNRNTQQISHRMYTNMMEFFHPGDVIVVNDTKVIKARLSAINAKGKSQELLLLESHGQKPEATEGLALFHGQLALGDVLSVGDASITIQEVLGNGVVKIYSPVPLLSLAETSGSVPLPPYIKRTTSKDDEARYQTLFAKYPGSVAAPTASLNFTDELRHALETKGVRVVSLTLHVGLGTFLPVRSKRVEDHHMHNEFFVLPKSTLTAIREAKSHGNKVIALGTTVARTLEYTADTILDTSQLKDTTGEANIFMYPGYTFKLVDHLITNFHAPRSTVLLLAAAFAGKELLTRSYTEALQMKYQFLSYGDSMLIL